jgi:deoxyribodipyrimidine photolyase-related protein
MEERIKKKYEKCKNIVMLETPNFLTTRGELLDYYHTKCDERRINHEKKLDKMTDNERHHLFKQTNFYMWQRYRLQILLNASGKPLGGKMTYDTENRKSIPAREKIPAIPRIGGKIIAEYIAEAREYIGRKYRENQGNVDGEILFPIMREDALKWFDEFLRDRLSKFGEYQDAFLKNSDPRDNRLLYHSGISPIMNIGLINPGDIISRTLTYYTRHSRAISLSTIEGFLRQIIGWREHCRYTYLFAYDYMRVRNYMQHQRPLPSSFYSGTTGIRPLDDTIVRAFETGYLHHILRLMVMGSFMLMAEIRPDDAYKWFYEFSLDSAEWNMINNVRSMALYADGGLYTTKPYIASSAYIEKMSNYGNIDDDKEKGDNKHHYKWTDIWDAFYWNFVNKNQKWIRKNGRLAMQVKYYNKKTQKEKKQYAKIFNDVMKKLMKK